MENRVKVYFRLVADEDGYPPAQVESVWAQPTSTPGEYVLDNIPFFVGSATIGDAVLTREEGGAFWFEKVTRRSRNSLVRVVFFDHLSFEKINNHLSSLGCATEYLKANNLLAVSVPETVSLQDVQAFLRAEAGAGTIDYEEPLLRQ